MASKNSRQKKMALQIPFLCNISRFEWLLSKWEHLVAKAPNGANISTSDGMSMWMECSRSSFPSDHQTCGWGGDISILQHQTIIQKQMRTNKFHPSIPPFPSCPQLWTRTHLDPFPANLSFSCPCCLGLETKSLGY